MPIERELQIGIFGRNSSTSAWATFFRDEGLPYVTYHTWDSSFVVDLAIILDRDCHSDNLPTTHHMIFVNRCPPQASILCEAGSDYIFDETLGEIACRFRGYAVHWDGPSIGWYYMARPEESPRFPIVCFDGNATYLVGDLDSNLMLRGFFFRPIPVQGEIELQLVHPYCRREQVIKFMRLMLRRAFDSINFPLCRLSPTPPGEPLPFIFRVDIDYMVDPGLGLLRRATADYGWKITGFINISGEELWEDTGIPPPNGRQNIENLRWIPDFAEEGHEVASHGVRHLLWAKRRNNFDDISEARKILEDLCNHPVVGHAFPGGLWHPEAALAASEAGFRYTTEAAIAWAGQPFISVERPYHLPLLQIPCSPVYPAFHELKRGGEEMFLRYFEIMAQQCMREKEMLSWMGHPFDLEPASDELWHTVEQIRANGGFKPVTMSEVDLMVRKRWQVKPRFTLNCGQWWVSANVEWDLLCQGIVIRIPAGGKKVIVTGKKISDI